MANLILWLTGCVEQYYPDENELRTGTVVAEAHLTDIPGEQAIRLSRSSTIRYPEFDPLTGCYVELEQLGGSSREFVEMEAGKYLCLLDGQFLEPGKEFRLFFITQEGTRYESEYEKLSLPLGIDSVYWEREDQSTSDPDVTREGIRFYLDFNMEKESSNYLLWELEETYELHNPEYRSFIVDKDRMVKELSDSCLWRRCWISRKVPRIQTIDLDLLEGSIYSRVPLFYVSGESRRLNIRYSLLVRQFSLTRSSFRYWNDLEMNLQSKVGLFEKQPILTTGNICNTDDAEEVVLGYFSISGVSERRIFVEDIPGMMQRDDPEYCFPGELPAKFNYLVKNYPPEKSPMYLSLSNDGKVDVFGVVEKQCIDCREYKGSSHIKPEFW